MREKKARLRHFTAALCLPAAMAIGALALAVPASAAPPASAASAARSTPAPPAAHISRQSAAYQRELGMAARIVTINRSHRSPAPSGAAASVSCRTISSTDDGYNIFGQMIWAYTLNTYFCWDGVTVTYHNTWSSSNIPGWSSVLGWEYKGVVNSSFDCRYATSRWCSENHEYSQAEYDFCPVHIGCVESVYPWINEWEYYDGAYVTNGGN